MDLDNQEIKLYFNQFSKDIQGRLQTIRTIAFELIPDTSEAIKYRMPTIMYKQNNVFHYAAFKNHIGIYPLPHTLEQLQDELKGYVQGKGSIQFPHDEPLPLPIIRKIIMVRFQEFKEAHH